MYTTHFGLREVPFNISPDPHFYYATPLHEDVYSGLLTHIRDRAGLILLTSEPGVGKTLLLHRLMSEVDDPISFVLFSNPTLTFDELLLSICKDLELEPAQGPVSDSLNLLHEFSIEDNVEGVGVCLLIDEAQDLSEETLYNLHQLLDLNHDGVPLLQIVLSGQPALETTLQQPGLNDIAQRIAVQYQLTALSNQEVGPFIQHRLNIAGGERQDIFPPDVVGRIGFYSQGIPRLINVICDNALLIAYTLSQEVVSVENIEEVAQDLSFLPASEETAREENSVAMAFSLEQVDTDERAGLIFAKVQTQNPTTSDTEEVTQALSPTLPAGGAVFDAGVSVGASSQEQTEAKMETDLALSDETSQDPLPDTTKEITQDFRFVLSTGDTPLDTTETQNSSSTEQSEEQVCSEEQATDTVPVLIQEHLGTDEQPGTTHWTAAAVSADEIASAETATNDSADGDQDSWSQDNWGNEAAPPQEEQDAFSLAPQGEQNGQDGKNKQPQSSRPGWLTRLTLGGGLFLVLGGAGFALSSRPSQDWLSTLQSKASSLLDAAPLSTLRQTWPSDPAPDKLKDTEATDVAVQQSALPFSHEEQLASAQHHQPAHLLDPVAPVNAVPPVLPGAAFVPPTSLDLPQEEDRAPAEASTPQQESQQQTQEAQETLAAVPTQAAQATPARQQIPEREKRESDEKERDALDTVEKTAVKIPAPLTAPAQLATRPSEPWVEAGGSGTVHKVNIRSDQPNQEKAYIQKKRDARIQLSRLGIPFQSSIFVKNAERGNSEVVDLFLAAGMHARITDKRHMTPLLVAAWNGHRTIVETLLSHSAELNKPNAHGLTPLMVAAWNGHIEVVRTLLSSGADVHATDENGYTALTYAEEDRNDAILGLLRQTQAQKQ